MKKEKSLIIWNKTGSTMKFEKVTNFIEDWQRDQISFEYFGISTQVRRKAKISTQVRREAKISTQVRREAKFYTKNIAGYALEQEEL
ncbi:hypothetical protein [Enterococcus hirae]|uniref:hypothetical protein n=1 Tax=Enterococcus hirae TaxID=1354 RepID=UPI000DE82774|nr:hypothetical protein [Enterococcus hirae]RBT40683.1 hypothetical protein EB07_02165 [Enterococcus hirae]